MPESAHQHMVYQLATQDEANRIIDFFYSPHAFTHEWAPGEKEIVARSVRQSIGKDNHHYWYIEDKGLLIGVIGVRENEYKSGGYEMKDDYFAVHDQFRKRGLGSVLLRTVERYVGTKKGRYIHIVSCDTDYYKPARFFYEKNGYIKVAELPDYYVVGEGRVDYYKQLK